MKAEKDKDKDKELNRVKEKLGHKEIGDRYLHHARSINREHITKKTKKHLMNLQTKVVGYGSDIMERIARNTASLSNMKNILMAQSSAEE